MRLKMMRFWDLRSKGNGRQDNGIRRVKRGWVFMLSGKRLRRNPWLREMESEEIGLVW